MDEETLKADPKALGGSSLNDFRALYASMKAEDSTEVGRHVRTVQAQWRKRGVSSRDSERIRLITVFFHDKPSEEESRPFIMGNDALMEGWRPGVENNRSVPQQYYHMIKR